MTAGPMGDSLSVVLADFEGLSLEEGLAFIAGTRRQFERLERLPSGARSPIDPEQSAAIRRECDEFEASIRSRYHPVLS